MIACPVILLCIVRITLWTQKAGQFHCLVNSENKGGEDESRPSVTEAVLAGVPHEQLQRQLYMSGPRGYASRAHLSAAQHAFSAFHGHMHEQ